MGIMYFPCVERSHAISDDFHIIAFILVVYSTWLGLCGREFILQ